MIFCVFGKCSTAKSIYYNINCLSCRYVAKCYRKTKNIQQYQQDVICQMTARYYATLFNQQLYQAGKHQFLS